PTRRSSDLMGALTKRHARALMADADLRLDGQAVDDPVALLLDADLGAYGITGYGDTAHIVVCHGQANLWRDRADAVEVFMAEAEDVMQEADRRATGEDGDDQ